MNLPVFLLLEVQSKCSSKVKGARQDSFEQFIIQFQGLMEEFGGVLIAHYQVLRRLEDEKVASPCFFTVISFPNDVAIEAFVSDDRYRLTANDLDINLAASYLVNEPIYDLSDGVVEQSRELNYPY